MQTAAGVPRLLAASALALVLTHWLRLAPLGYRGVAATRWEDFVDLLTPYVVAGPALAVLARLDAPRRLWAAALLGCALFVQGHALHLSANSITFASGSAAPAYLWDEQVGHHLWFVGLTMLILAVDRAVRELPLRAGPAPTALAALVGITWAANVVEAGAAPLGSALAAVLVVHGWRLRGLAVGRLIVVAYALSLLLIAAYGVLLGGYPQPSELGWL